MHRFSKVNSLILAVACMACSSTAAAQSGASAQGDAQAGAGASAAGAPAAAGSAEGSAGADMFAADSGGQWTPTGGQAQAEADPTDPSEDPLKGYYFLGAFYRHIFVPYYVQNLFLEESPGANNSAFGIELTYRKDNFDIVGSIWWASYNAYGPYRANNDPEQDTEIIDSGLNAVFFSGSFLWSTNFDKKGIVALEYGVDVGLGLLLGDVQRTEAYRNPDGSWEPCNAPGDPHPGYCDGPSVQDGERGGHYRVKARKWTDGGSVPNVVPWIALPHLALRIKPIKQLMMRIEGGIGLGFFMGGSVAYGF